MSNYKESSWYISAKKAAEKQFLSLNLTSFSEVRISKTDSGWVFHAPEVAVGKAKDRELLGLTNYQFAVDAFTAAIDAYEAQGVKTVIVYGYPKPKEISQIERKINVAFAPKDEIQSQIFRELAMQHNAIRDPSRSKL